MRSTTPGEIPIRHGKILTGDARTALAVNHDGPFQLIIADPPYSSDDAKRYGTPMINRLAVLNALAEVALPGGYLAWLDQVWPQHKSEQWQTVARIAVTRCTNHRTRDLTIFQRRLSS